MYVFVCAGCGAELTAPLSQVALPVHARQMYGDGVQLPVLMETGTFAVDPEPWGPPVRRWEEIDPAEAEARGIYAPVPALSDGLPGAVVIAPGDVRGTVLIPEKAGGYCCGLDWGDGPNLACEACGLAVASRIDDCSLWQAVWFTPDVVRDVLVDDGDATTLSWDELLAEGTRTPPFEPIAPWGARGGSRRHWSWSPQWEAAAGQALAHLLVASGGRPVTVPDGLIREVFQHTLDTLLPVGPPERRAVLTGPGLPGPDASDDILFVPVHPQTGKTWDPAGSPGPPGPPGPPLRAYRIPLPFGVWSWLAFPEPDLPVPSSGRILDDILRDDPLPPRPPHLLRADRNIFRRTLVRLPAVRSPWLREIVGNTGEAWN
ncbi:hypothetical protein [Streptomyces collinus]|uniref:hypothetical protein n=1 Tax=Streptomyces collinus TaxID=42684 RepID=UPI00363427E1